MTTPNNLPAELSSFIGRERQLAELRRLMRKARVITLTGPGGAGKTRVALRLAASVLDRHPDGVWLVELATVSDARFLERTVASACRVREDQSRATYDVVAEWLKNRRSLLILDGCEHLVDACAALVTSLLRSCPTLKLLVTSREPLGVPGELIWRTPSLSLPLMEEGAHTELLLESEAVRLFIERVELSRPDFPLSGSAEALATAQICTRLEGIPLALELAAGLARVMTLDEILDRLRDRFRLLTGGNRGALPRHQTLRQAVDWSYDLLSDAEKALLERLSVFAGGFDAEAAEAVAQEEPLDPEGVVAILSRLVNKSLVVAEPGRQRTTRYRLLDTIREYAAEKLPRGEESDLRTRHARHFVAWAARAGRELRGPDPLPWLERLDVEQANIRLALAWSLMEQPDEALKMAAAMGTYWHLRRHLAEGMEWLGQALELATPSLDARAAALWSRARMRGLQGEYDAARSDAEECATLSRRLGLQVELAGALNILGLVSGAENDMVTAERYLEEAGQLSRRSDNHEGVAASLNNLALFASARGDNLRARILLEEALRESRIAGNRISAANSMDSLARVCLQLGDIEAARDYFHRSLEMSARFEDVLNLAEALEGLALFALAERDHARVIGLIAAAGSMRRASGSQAMPEMRKQVNEGLAAARAELGAQVADAAWQRGAAMSMQEAVRYASGTASAAPRTSGGPLTGREAQVARLIAEGLTNPEIATRLRIAERTVDAHLEHIRNKLGLRTRTQIALWARERLGTS